MKKHVRTLWLSDIHLGTRWCKSKILLDFLKHHTAENLFLVGDIVDSWNKNYWYTDYTQNRVIEYLTDFSKFKSIYYIDGNHDDYHNNKQHISEVLALPVIQEASYTTLNNKNLLVIHGHQFDSFKNPSKQSIYRKLYSLMTHKNKNFFSKTFDKVVQFVLKFDLERFKNRTMKIAKNRGYDGVICGHTHNPQVAESEFGIYYNCGDWINLNHCTAVIENNEGEINLVYWK